MTQAASFSNPGGKLSMKANFVNLIVLSSRSTSSLDIGPNFNYLSILWGIAAGFLHTKSRKGIALSLNFDMTVAQNVPKALDNWPGSFVFMPSISNECIDGLTVDFMCRVLNSFSLL